MLLNKKKYLFIISAVFFSYAYSQKVDTSKTIFAGVFISPDYSIGLVPNGVANDPGFNTRYVDKGIFAYTAGGFVDFKLRKRINVSAGFSYSKKGFDTYYYFRNNYFRFNDTLVQEHRYSLYEIPVKVKYYFVLKKINLFASIGMAVTLPKSSSHQVVYTNFPYRNSGFLNVEEKRNVEFMFGFGADIRIKQKVLLTIQPEYRYLRNELEYPNLRWLYTFGFNTGIKFEI